MSKPIDAFNLGEIIGESPWIEISQTLIDQFAECTGDRQWIHVDRERAQRESPFGTTIAHGYLILSLAPKEFYKLVSIPQANHALVNYGMDKLRFMEPVRAGDVIRFRMTLGDVTVRGTGRIYRIDCVAEIEGRKRPALRGCMQILSVAM